MKAGEIWRFRAKSKAKREEMENDFREPENEDDYFFVIYPEVIKIVRKLEGDTWLVVAMYNDPQAKDEMEAKEMSGDFDDVFRFVETGEAETHEITGQEIYKNYELVRDPKFIEQYEEGELYEIKMDDKDEI